MRFRFVDLKISKDEIEKGLELVTQMNEFMGFVKDIGKVLGGPDPVPVDEGGVGEGGPSTSSGGSSASSYSRAGFP